MGTFANEDVLYTNNPSPSTGTGLLQMRQNQKAIKELVGASAPVTLEIVDGSITPTSAFVLVDTEGQAAADDLTVINVVVDATNTLHDGMLLYLQAADAGRVVTVKNSSSANGIRTAGGGDITLVTDAWLVLQLRSGTWYELAVQPSGVIPIANGGTGSSTKNFVDLSSAQTVAGTKTLTAYPIVKNNNPLILLQQTDITKGTNPAANQTAVISMVDSAGTAGKNRTGYLENRVTTTGLTSTSLFAYQFANGSTANAQLGVYCSADGNTKYATAPTPAAGDNSTKIATTAWVNNQISKDISSILFQKIFQSSGSFSDTVDRHVRMTIVAGGGSGGNGSNDVYGASNSAGLGGRKGGNSEVTIPAGATLDGVLLTSSRTLTVNGGAAGNGGGRYGGGGGGEAGNFEEHELILPAGLALTFTIGAGGEPYTSGTMSSTVGGIGEGNPCQTGAPEGWGGASGPGGTDGICGNMPNTRFGGGDGGRKHPQFGGGGPGGPRHYAANGDMRLYPVRGGRPGPGAGEASVITARANPPEQYSRGGRGGDGALILEYWNSFAA